MPPRPMRGLIGDCEQEPHQPVVRSRLVNPIPFSLELHLDEYELEIVGINDVVLNALFPEIRAADS